MKRPETGTTDPVQYAPPKYLNTPPAKVKRYDYYKNDHSIPWIGVALILLSLLLPYVSFLGMSLSGYELFELVGEEIIDMGNEGTDSGNSGNGVDASMEIKFFVIAIMMLAFSPFIFIFTSIVSTLLLLTGKSPKIIGYLHLIYALIFICLSLGGNGLLFNVTGGGFYVGAFSSILLLLSK